MYKKLTILLLFFLSIANSKDLTYLELEKRNGLYFNGNSTIPFTGNVKGLIIVSFV